MSVSGDMEVTSLPASYTVSATGTNCTVTSIYWLDSSGTKYTVKTGSSSSLSYTFTASAESAFPHSRVYYCTTSASGVTGTVSVNFTFAKYAAAGIKWSKDGSTLRTISLNGTVIKDGLSVRQLEDKVRKFLEPKVKTEKASLEQDLPEEHFKVLEIVGKYFENNISLKRSENGKGSMTIHFNNDEEVKKFLKALEDSNV
jgi:hypothetical protein